ncbi:unnamed protein product [Rangifer tarandus platyrhynchus]|uniref:Uncharacterized protein n=1 Tax=Rangifer tarandus platyrhynchus TaxID=3082113 RepID=A0AC59ZMD0_RANTA
MLFLATQAELEAFSLERETPQPLHKLTAHAVLQHTALLPCICFMPGVCGLLRPFSHMNQSSKRVSSTPRAASCMNPKVAEVPSDECTKRPVEFHQQLHSQVQTSACLPHSCLYH